MSIIAGAIRLAPGALSETDVRSLRAGFRFPDWTHNEFQGPNVLILNATLSLFGTPDWCESATRVAMVAGRLYSNDSSQDELQVLGQALLSDTAPSLLRSANGTFVALAYDKERFVLRIASDSLGARPLYYTESEHTLFFSTSIELFRRSGVADLALDITAFAEQEAICYPLGPRTVFGAVKVLTDNQLLTVRDGRYSIEPYFSWCDVAPAVDAEPDQIAKEAAAAVREAVRVRSDPDRRTEVSLLSGGLDSRVIVSELARNGRPVRALNLSREGSQDHVYAARFADLIGVSFERSEWSPLLPGVSAGQTTARMLAAALRPLSQGVAFSGDGGGETLGFLLIEPSTCRMLASGQLEAAVNDHVHCYQAPQRLLQRETRRRMAGIVQQRLADDILSRGDDYQKALQRSVLLNDLRCHLHEYFERIGTTKVELLLPFYDRRVVESVLRIGSPLEQHLYHRFYARVLTHLDAAISRVPWQVYPGRTPSPVPPDSTLPDQWSGSTWQLGDDLAAQLRLTMKNRQLSRHIRLPTVLIALMLHRFRIRNYTSVFKTALGLSQLDLAKKSRSTEVRAM